MNDFRSQLKNQQKLVLYLFLGVIWSLSNVGYVKYFGSVFAWFTFAPVIYFLKEEKTADGIKYVTLFGFIAYLTHFWWLIVPVTGMTTVFGLPGWLMPFSFLLALAVLLILSLFSGLNYTLCYLAARLTGKNHPFLFYSTFAVAGTVFDYFYPKLWADYLGYSQYQMFNVIQAVDLFGISYITFLIMLVNSAIAYLLETVPGEKKFNKLSGFYALSVLVLVTITAIYGGLRSEFISRAMVAAKKVSVGIVQGNISGAEKKKKNSNEMISVYGDLSAELLADHPQLIVWPESAIPVWFNEDQTDFSRVRKFPGKSLLLFGGHARKDNGLGKSSDIYNSLFLVDGDGKKLNSYYKNKLLPFVERAPVRMLSFMISMMGLKEFSPGAGPRFIQQDDLRLAVNICYEAIIPEYIRKSIRRKDKTAANLLVNCTNDSWFGRTIEPEMHLRITTIRAIENRRCLVRSTCTGYSVIADANGHINYRSRLYQPATHTAKVPLLNVSSVYTNWGWRFIYLLGFVFAIYLAVFVYYRVQFYFFVTRRARLAEYQRRRREAWMR